MSKRKNLDDDLYGKQDGFFKESWADQTDIYGYGYTTTASKPGYTSTSSTVGGKSDWWKDRCTHNHPALKIPGTELVIYGGACSSPSVTDADVYIGFDWGMKFTQRHWPWKKGTEVLFEIKDMHAPADPVEFNKLVKWTGDALRKGLKVHCGCIGGHGRTGTFLAALVADMSNEKDAIEYVRKHYCEKAVETKEQVDFLVKHYGINSVVLPSKSYSKTSYKADKPDKKLAKLKKLDFKKLPEGDILSPLSSPKCIW